ncbi:MAG: peptide chain release factor 2 [Candidatus Buchananbacteria bacterium CG10_big_fil_rev_8_21_14_0_10_42_9]|uniref:Peptide chain release factor 2 n=1 Tax=Candidatus Buchananbacteria bacterium CG10_big_fil_rev_8_21_14_0_10_42_9 TaxID=1974526 RepID=A0A2H0W210_9BACT|nr:MAG: peptide chain release factor 2 [Candidatus Buchananbacteria bacterium CG10_big_fil_rev_8_21_14_0_10_42_9]
MRGGYFDLEGLKQRLVKFEQEMAAPDFWQDQSRAAKVSQEAEHLKQDILAWDNLSSEIESAKSLAEELAEADDHSLEKELNRKYQELLKQYQEREFFLLFSGKHDKSDAVLTIHAGTGGTEAQDWTEMLMRMYLRFCEKRGWATTVIDEARGNEAGVKRVSIEVSGRYAFGHLKAEAGTHRLVRISPFDAEKMRHTSFALVEVVPIFPELTDEDVVIKDEDLRVDVFRSSGKGGQSVNTTDSAVRMVHVPTGITVSCQNERSQAQNKATALKILKSKLFLRKMEERQKEQDSARGEVLPAAWGNQIRSYVLHPYHMVKDHRTNFETSNPGVVLDGDLDNFIKAYLEHSVKANESNN